jgi:hypothetical protein
MIIFLFVSFFNFLITVIIDVVSCRSAAGNLIIDAARAIANANALIAKQQNVSI